MTITFIEKDKTTKIEMDEKNMYDKLKVMQERFDNKEIQKYEIEFVEGVKVKDIQYLEDISPSMIASLILRIR